MLNPNSPIKPLRQLPPFKRDDSSGNLYYVRLKTPFGLMYKLGYTSMESVETRLAFKGAGDEKHIDKVLIFLPFDDAYDIEEVLHEYFATKSFFRNYQDFDMPLSGNGQTELYLEDILGLDREYSANQAVETHQCIRRYQMKRNGTEDEKIEESLQRIPEDLELQKTLEDGFGWLFRLYSKVLNFFDSENAKAKYAATQWKNKLAIEYIARIHDQVRIERQRKLATLKRELREQESLHC